MFWRHVFISLPSDFGTFANHCNMQRVATGRWRTASVASRTSRNHRAVASWINWQREMWLDRYEGCNRRRSVRPPAWALPSLLNSEGVKEHPFSCGCYHKCRLTVNSYRLQHFFNEQTSLPLFSESWRSLCDLAACSALPLNPLALRWEVPLQSGSQWCCVSSGVTLGGTTMPKRRINVGNIE